MTTIEEPAKSPLRIVAPTFWAEALRDQLTVAATFVEVASTEDGDVVPVLDGADVFITTRFTPAMADAGSGLRLIQVFGAGAEGVDFTAVAAETAVCNVYGHEHGIAEYVFAAMVMLQRDVPGQDRRLRRGEWGERRLQSELRGRRLGIVGLGRLGAELARWGRFYEMEVRAVTRRPEPARAAALGLSWLGGHGDVLHLLPEVDFVVVAVPQTAETRGLIGERELAAMKPSAFLINVARGPVVDGDALFRALRERQIAGAALDVWYHYPTGGGDPCSPADQAFHTLENVLMTPHQSGWTDGTVAHRAREIAENIRRLRDGEPLLNPVARP